MLRTGSMSLPAATGDLATFTRGDGGIFCAFNLGDGSASATLPEGRWTRIGEDVGSIRADANGRIALGPWAFALARRT
jgi:alpha-glucosidase